MRGLERKRAVVTGGAQGIGRACVEAFTGYNCSVVFCDLEADTGSDTEEELREQGANVFFIQGDMSYVSTE